MLVQWCVAGSIPAGVVLCAMQTLLVSTFTESTNFFKCFYLCNNAGKVYDKHCTCFFFMVIHDPMYDYSDVHMFHI